jgi:hypothetical protein
VALRAELSSECLVVISVKHEVLSEPKIFIVEKLKGDISSFAVNYCIKRMLIAVVTGEEFKEKVLVLETYSYK